MRKLMITAGAAALLAASSLAALAADVTGSITAVDPAAGTVTLDSGNTFVLPANFDAASLQVGTSVTITYEDVGGQMTATTISAGGG